MAGCHACCQKPCVCTDANGPRKPYEDEPCAHECDAEEDHDARELICTMCGHREPMPVDWPST